MVTARLRLGAAEKGWRSLRRRAGQETFKRRPPPRIDEKRKAAFQEAVLHRVDWERTQGQVGVLTELATWAGDLWQFRRGRKEGWQVMVEEEGGWHMQPKNKRKGNRIPGERRTSVELRLKEGQAREMGGWTAR